MSSPSPSSSQGFPPPPSNSNPTNKTHFTGREQTSNPSLYLIAFLAILFLLLIISAGFIARSYILRRRYQRRLEDAMGPGQLLATPRAQGSKIKRLGTLPKITNAWLAEGGDRWNQMMPISAQPVFVKRKVRVKQNTPDQTTNNSDTTAPPTRMTNLFSRFRPSLLLHNTLELDEKQTPIPSTPNYRIRVEMLQLAVLVAMPSPRTRSRRKDPILEKDLDLDPDDDEKDDELPDVVFGVTRVNYQQPPSPTLQPKQSPHGPTTASFPVDRPVFIIDFGKPKHDYPL